MNVHVRVKERPVLFSAPMVQAILEGRKTQTRRIVKPQPYGSDDFFHIEYSRQKFGGPKDYLLRILAQYGCPYGQPGDRLWVREKHQFWDWDEDGLPKMRYAADRECMWQHPDENSQQRVYDIWAKLSESENYSLDGTARDRKWRPSIHMPRWASRILLEIVSVRVEQLQDISEADAIAEGAPAGMVGDEASCWFENLWGDIHGIDFMDANPWVWVLEFKRVEA